jgi:hypothetical protein
MDSMQILCTLRDVRSSIGLFPSVLLPRFITQSGTVIIKADPDTEKGSHWLVTNFQPLSYSTYHVDSYGIPHLSLLSKHSWDAITLFGVTTIYNCRVELSTVFGIYCCLFVLYMDRWYTTKQVIGLFDADIADRQREEMFISEFGPLSRDPRGGQCSCSKNKRYVTTHKSIIFYL